MNGGKDFIIFTILVDISDSWQFMRNLIFLIIFQFQNQ